MNKRRRHKAKSRRKNFPHPVFVSRFYFTHACDLCNKYYFYDWHRCALKYNPAKPEDEDFMEEDLKRCNKFQLNLELMKNAKP